MKKKVSINKTLNQIKKNINIGYTHDNFDEIAKLMKTLESHIAPSDYRLLSELWRNSYVDDCDTTTLNKVINGLKIKKESKDSN